MSSIKSEKCQIYLGINSNRANFSSVDCQSSIMVRVKMRAPYLYLWIFFPMKWIIKSLETYKSKMWLLENIEPNLSFPWFPNFEIAKALSLILMPRQGTHFFFPVFYFCRISIKTWKYLLNRHYFKWSRHSNFPYCFHVISCPFHLFCINFEPGKA